MTHPRVLCVGEMLFDRLSDRPGKPLEEVDSWTDYPGGAPANTACALVKLGVPTAFIGGIGEDEPGETLVQLLTEIGVDRTGVQRHPTAPTRIVYVVRDREGDRSFAGFGDLDTAEFADTRLQAGDIPVSLFETAEFLVLGTLELAYPDSKAAILRSLSLAQENGVKVFMDVNWRPVFWQDSQTARSQIQTFVQQADFLKLTDEEGEFLFGTAEPRAIAAQLDRAQGVLVTAGEKGCAYSLGGNEGQMTAFPVTVQDTTGAGDGFTAGILAQLCQHGIELLNNPDLAKQAVTYASAVGALTALKPGAIAAQPTAAEVKAFLNKAEG